jgi:hypothetical protein
VPLDVRCISSLCNARDSAGAWHATQYHSPEWNAQTNQLQVRVFEPRGLTVGAMSRHPHQAGTEQTLDFLY